MKGGGGEKKGNMLRSLSLQNICWNQRSTTNTSKIYIWSRVTRDSSTWLVRRQGFSHIGLICHWIYTKPAGTNQSTKQENVAQNLKGKISTTYFSFFFGPMESEHRAKIGFDNLCNCVQAALGNSANWHFSDIATLRSLHTIKFYFFFFFKHIHKFVQ